MNADEYTPMTYGIKGVDDALGNYLNPGHLHLFGGASGSGKTALACQLTVANTLLGKKVLYVSSEEAYEDYFIRCVAGGVGIPYGKPMKFEHLNDGPPHMLNPYGYSEHQLLKSVKVLQGLNLRADFYEIDVSAEDDLAAAIGEKVDSLRPDLVILDYLRVSTVALNTHQQRAQMLNVMEALRVFSRAMEINIVVLAQLNPDFIDRAIVPVTATSNCRTLHEYADVSMAMSWLKVPELDGAKAAGCRLRETYLREQFVNIESKQVNTVIPVKTHYHRMALEDGEHEVDKRHRDHITVNRDQNKARVVLDVGGMRNYVWLGRSVYERVCKIGYPPAVNVYIFHMLVANRSGWSHHSYKGMAEKLGLSVEQIRTAVDHLKRVKLLQGKGKVRDMKRQVVKLDENTANGDDKGGVKLNQNMTRKEFTVMRNPEKFRLWIWLLIHAESNYESGEYRPGEVVVIPIKLAETLKISTAFIVEGLQEFIKDERLIVTYGDTGHSSFRVRLLNWAVYQYEIPRELSLGYRRTRG